MGVKAREKDEEMDAGADKLTRKQKKALKAAQATNGQINGEAATVQNGEAGAVDSGDVKDQKEKKKQKEDVKAVVELAEQVLSLIEVIWWGFSSISDLPLDI